MTASQPFTISTWKWLLGLSVFFLALLISVPSFARIVVTLENPGQGDTASGVTAISGWTYSTEGADVTVKLRLNGETGEEIPCCGPREDVKYALSDAPLETGFGLLFNYGRLPAGVHTVGVEVSAGEEIMVVDHAVTVVVPADSEFLSAVDLSGASASIEGDKIVVSGVEVTDKDSGDMMTVDVDLNYKTGLQSFQITEAQGSAADLHVEEILMDVAHAIFATYDALNMAAHDPDASQERPSEGASADVSTLSSAVFSLVGISAGSPDAAIALLPAVQHAWRDARIPWEQSEAFLFGPVDTDEHDPFLDTWPLNVTDLEAIIASNEDIETVELADDVQGFHALEYLLFQDMNGNTDPAAIVNALHTGERRRAYMRRVMGLFTDHTQALRDSWDPEMGDFVAELAEAGHGSMTYPSERAAMQTLLEAMIGIAAELHDAKLGASSPAEEESRFSNNSRIDFLNNVRSINNVYEGRFDQSDSTSMGVTDFVAHENPALDAEVRMAIRDAKAAIIAIPEPFGTSITAHPDAVAKAIEAAVALEAKLGEVLEAVNAADFGHDH